VGLAATRDGKPVGVITSEKRQHVDSQDQPTFEPSTEVGILESLKQDTYVVLAGVTGTDRASCASPSTRSWCGRGSARDHGGRRAHRDVAAGERRRPQSGYGATLPPVAVGASCPARGACRVRAGRGRPRGRVVNDVRAGVGAARLSRRRFVALLGGGRPRPRRSRPASCAAGFSTNPIPTPDQPAAGGEGPPSSASNVPDGPDRVQAGRRAAQANARPQLTAQQRDALEHHAQVPVPVHARRVHLPHDRLLLRRVAGDAPGRDAPRRRRVLGRRDHRAFTQVYGERVLMAPTKAGFNWAGYAMPFAALGGGAVVVAGLMRRWSQRAAAVAAAQRAEHAGRASGNGHGAYDPAVDATPDELARLAAAVRGGDDDR
jgi:hypothetical protein